MKIVLTKPIGSGAQAEVWRGFDELERAVAVKFLRHSLGDQRDQAIAHGRALAKVDHPNVVRVYGVQDVDIPGTGETGFGVVMGYLSGESLMARLGKSVSRGEALEIGTGLVDGLEAIHTAGHSHGDLHAANVMLHEGRAVIIDIYATESLMRVSTMSRADQVLKDVSSARALLGHLLSNCHELDYSRSMEFRQVVIGSLHALRESFVAIVEDEFEDPLDLATEIQVAYARVVDEGFVDTVAYGHALCDEIPADAYGGFVRKLVEDGVIQNKHMNFIREIGRRLAEQDLDSLAEVVSDSLDSTVPDGNWAPTMRVLKELATRLWPRIRRTTRIRLEGAITRDVSNGKYDYYQGRLQSGGLGTWANALGVLFQDRDGLVRALRTALHQSWYTQNYVAEYFFGSMERLADTPERKNLVMEGIRAALSNKAHVVERKLTNLPSAWVAELAEP